MGHRKWTNKYCFFWQNWNSFTRCLGSRADNWRLFQGWIHISENRKIYYTGANFSKAEALLPVAYSEMIQNGKGRIRILPWKIMWEIIKLFYNLWYFISIENKGGCQTWIAFWTEWISIWSTWCWTWQRVWGFEFILYEF